MVRIKPITDSGEVGRRKEEKRSNLFWPVGIALALGLVFAGIFSFVLPNLQQSAMDSRIGEGISVGNQPQQPVPQAPNPPVKTEVPTPTPTPTSTTKMLPIDLPMKVSPHINQADLKLNLFYTGDSPLIKGDIEYPYLKDGTALKIVLLKDGRQVEGYALSQKAFSFEFLKREVVVMDVAEVKNRYTIWVTVQ